MNKLKKTKFSFKSFLSRKKTNASDAAIDRTPVVTNIMDDRKNNTIAKKALVKTINTSAASTKNASIKTTNTSTTNVEKTSVFGTKLSMAFSSIKNSKIVSKPLALINSAFDKIDLAILKLLDKLGLTGKMGRITRANAVWRIVPLTLIIGVGAFAIINLTGTTNAARVSIRARQIPTNQICDDVLGCSISQDQIATKAIPTPYEILDRKVKTSSWSKLNKKFLNNTGSGVINKGAKWVSMGGYSKNNDQRYYGLRVGRIKNVDTTQSIGDLNNEDEPDPDDEDEEEHGGGDDVDVESNSYGSNAVHFAIDEASKRIGVTYDLLGNNKEKFNKLSWFDYENVCNKSLTSDQCKAYESTKIEFNFLDKGDKWDTLYGGFIFSGGSYKRANIYNQSGEWKTIQKIYNTSVKGPVVSGKQTYPNPSILHIGSKIIVNDFYNSGESIAHIYGHVRNLYVGSGIVYIEEDAWVDNITVKGNGRVIISGDNPVIGNTGNDERGTIIVDGNNPSDPAIVEFLKPTTTTTNDTSLVDFARVSASIDIGKNAWVTVRGYTKIWGNIKIGAKADNSVLTFVGNPVVEGNLNFASDSEVRTMGGEFKDSTIITSNPENSGINYNYAFKYIFPGFSYYHPSNDEIDNGYKIFLAVDILAKKDVYMGINDTETFEGVDVEGKERNGETYYLNSYVVPPEVQKMFGIHHTITQDDKLTYKDGSTLWNQAMFGIESETTIEVTSKNNPGTVKINAQVCVKAGKGPADCLDDTTVNGKTYHYNAVSNVRIMNVNVYDYDLSSGVTTVKYKRKDDATKLGVYWIKKILREFDNPKSLGGGVEDYYNREVLIGGAAYSGKAAIKAAADNDWKINIKLENGYTEEGLDQQVCAAILGQETYSNFATWWNIGFKVLITNDATSEDGDEVAFFSRLTEDVEMNKIAQNISFSTAIYIPSQLYVKMIDASVKTKMALLVLNASGNIEQINENGYTLVPIPEISEYYAVFSTQYIYQYGTMSVMYNGYYNSNIYNYSEHGDKSEYEKRPYYSVKNRGDLMCAKTTQLILKADKEGSVRNIVGAAPYKAGESIKINYTLNGYRFKGSGIDKNLTSNGEDYDLASNQYVTWTTNFAGLNQYLGLKSARTEKLPTEVTTEGTMIDTYKEPTKQEEGKHKIDLKILVDPGNFTVAYDCNGGRVTATAKRKTELSYNSVTRVYEQEFKGDVKQALVTDVCEYDGRIFKGWKRSLNYDDNGDDSTITPDLKNGESITFPTVLGETFQDGAQLSLTALWTEDKEVYKYNLDFDGDEGVDFITIKEKNGETRQWSGEYQDGTELVITVRTKKGYKMAGWGSTNGTYWKDVLQQSPSQDDANEYIFTMKMPMYSYALTAFTNKTQKYTINYSCNGGNGYVGPQTAYYDVRIRLHSLSACWRDGYTFLGWSSEQANTISDLNTSATIFVDGQEVVSLGDITLYAVWGERGSDPEPVLSLPHTIRVVAGYGVSNVHLSYYGGDSINSDSSEFIPGTKFKITAEYEPEFEFSNWGSSSAVNIPSEDGVIEMDQNIYNDPNGLVVYVYASKPQKLYTIIYESNGKNLADAIGMQTDPDDEDTDDEEDADDDPEDQIYDGVGESFCIIPTQKVAYGQEKNRVRSMVCEEQRNDDETEAFTHNGKWSKDLSYPIPVSTVDSVDIIGGQDFVIPRRSAPNAYPADDVMQPTGGSSKITLYAVWFQEDPSLNEVILDIDSQSRGLIHSVGTKDMKSYYASGAVVELTQSSDASVSGLNQQNSSIGNGVTWLSDSTISITDNKFSMPGSTVNITGSAASTGGKFKICYHANTGNEAYDNQFEPCKMYSEHYISDIYEDKVWPVEFAKEYVTAVGSTETKTYIRNLKWLPDSQSTDGDRHYDYYSINTAVSSVVDFSTLTDGTVIDLYAVYGAPAANTAEYRKVQAGTVTLIKESKMSSAEFDSPRAISTKLLGVSQEYSINSDVSMSAIWPNYYTDPLWIPKSIDFNISNPIDMGPNNSRQTANFKHTTDYPTFVIVGTIGSKMFTVASDCNGGNGNLGSFQRKYNETIRTYSKYSCSRGAGYELVGWSRTAAASAKEYDTNADVAISTIFQGLTDTTTTLYAVWTSPIPAECLDDAGNNICHAVSVSIKNSHIGTVTVNGNGAVDGSKIYVVPSTQFTVNANLTEGSSSYRIIYDYEAGDSINGKGSTGSGVTFTDVMPNYDVPVVLDAEGVHPDCESGTEECHTIRIGFTNKYATTITLKSSDNLYDEETDHSKFITHTVPVNNESKTTAVFDETAAFHTFKSEVYTNLRITDNVVNLTMGNSDINGYWGGGKSNCENISDCNYTVSVKRDNGMNSVEIQAQSGLMSKDKATKEDDDREAQLAVSGSDKILSIGEKLAEMDYMKYSFPILAIGASDAIRENTSSITFNVENRDIEGRFWAGKCDSNSDCKYIVDVLADGVRSVAIRRSSDKAVMDSAHMGEMATHGFGEGTDVITEATDDSDKVKYYFTNGSGDGKSYSFKVNNNVNGRFTKKIIHEYCVGHLEKCSEASVEIGGNNYVKTVYLNYPEFTADGKTYRPVTYSEEHIHTNESSGIDISVVMPLTSDTKVQATAKADFIEGTNTKVFELDGSNKKLDSSNSYAFDVTNNGNKGYFLGSKYTGEYSVTASVETGITGAKLKSGEKNETGSQKVVLPLSSGNEEVEVYAKRDNSYDYTAYHFNISNGTGETSDNGNGEEPQLLTTFKLSGSDVSGQIFAGRNFCTETIGCYVATVNEDAAQISKLIIGVANDPTKQLESSSGTVSARFNSGKQTVNTSATVTKDNEASYGYVEYDFGGLGSGKGESFSFEMPSNDTSGKYIWTSQSKACADQPNTCHNVKVVAGDHTQNVTLKIPDDNYIDSGKAPNRDVKSNTEVKTSVTLENGQDYAEYETTPTYRKGRGTSDEFNTPDFNVSEEYTGGKSLCEDNNSSDCHYVEIVAGNGIESASAESKGFVQTAERKALIRTDSKVIAKSVRKDGFNFTDYEYTMSGSTNRGESESFTIDKLTNDLYGKFTAGKNACGNDSQNCHKATIKASQGVSTVRIESNEVTDSGTEAVLMKVKSGNPVNFGGTLNDGYTMMYVSETSGISKDSINGSNGSYNTRMPNNAITIALAGSKGQVKCSDGSYAATEADCPGGGGNGTRNCVGDICVVCDEQGNCKVCVGNYCVSCKDRAECEKCLTGTCEICDEEGNCIYCNNYICRYCNKDKECVVCVYGTCIICEGDECKCPETGACNITDPTNPKKRIVCKNFVCMVCDDNGQCKVCVGGMCVKCTETECLKCVLEGECQICDDEGNCIYCSGGSCTICDRYGNCKNCVNGVCTACTRDRCPNVPGTGYSTDPNEADKFSSSVPLVLSAIIISSGIYLVYYYKYKKKSIKIAQIRDKYWTGQR